MKKNLLFIFLIISCTCAAQSFSGPESVVYDSANNRYFISNNGTNQILARDSVGTLTVFTSTITSGPNGLEIVGDTLYACDGAYMKGFDLASGSLVMNLNLGATFLNGICTDGTNYLYTTDFTARKIFKINIATQTFTTFVTSLAKSPNGIIYDGANNRVIWVTWGGSAPIMQALLSDSSVSQVTATTLSNCDGIVRDGAGNYFVSAWTTQSIYKFDNIFSAAPVAVVTGLSNPADIYYNLNDDSLVCPNANNNTVTFHYMGTGSSVEENDENRFVIFPNPAVNEFTIYDLRFTISTIEIFSILGEKIYSQQETSNRQPVTVDIHQLPSGIYFVRVRTDKGMSTAKFVKE